MAFKYTTKAKMIYPSLYFLSLTLSEMRLIQKLLSVLLFRRKNIEPQQHGYYHCEAYENNDSKWVARGWGAGASHGGERRAP